MDTPPTLIHNGLTLLAAPRTTLSSLLPVLIARLALNGGLRVLDGGNRFNAYQTSRELRRQTENLTQVLERIQIARAFTCYQMTALLFETGSMKTPTLVLDLLVTFGDESVRLAERQRLLRSAMRQLKYLACAAPLAVTLATPSTVESTLVRQLVETADHTWTIKTPQIQPPLRLF